MQQSTQNIKIFFSLNPKTIFIFLHADPKQEKEITP